MTKDAALRGILQEWRRLPESERQSEDQQTIFAFKMMQDSRYTFTARGDRYQDIMGYLRRHTTGLKRMGL